MNRTKAAIIQDADRIIQTYGKLGSPLDCLTPLVEHCLNRKKALLHIYHSTQRETFVKQLDRICFYAMTQYLETVTAGLTLSSEDREILIRFYKCTLTGILLDWLDAGMSYDLLKSFSRMTELLGDSNKLAILKAAGSPAEES